MIKSYNLIIGLIIVFLLTGCEKKENNNFSYDIDYIKYGTSFGECLGYCRNDISVKNSEIVFHKSGWDLGGILPEISDTATINSKYWKELIDNMNFDSFLKLDSIIGCPDCADGGAEWIEIKSKEKTYKVIFEYRNEPDETKDYIGYLRTYMNTFQIDSVETVDFNERTIINQHGFIKNFVATRGSYQWLIGINSNDETTYYYDKYLDNEYHEDNLKIEFNGVLEYDSTTINKPAPNDIPVPDFKVRNIRTFDIKTIEE